MASVRQKLRRELKDHVELLIVFQQELCAICGQKPLATNHHNKLQVDHCHTTHEIRGLLCSRCNVGLGGFRDDPELLRKAIEYLQGRYRLPGPSVKPDRAKTKEHISKSVVKAWEEGRLRGNTRVKTH